MEKLTLDDLKFLLHSKAALRFQHDAYNKQMETEGFINGDAYSLSSIRQWFPPTEEKVAKFEKELRKKLHKVFSAFMAAPANYNGSLLLLKDVRSASHPITDRAYEPPFYTVGAGTRHNLDQIMARVDTSEDIIVNQLGFRRDGTIPNSHEPVVQYLTDQVIDRIIQSRKNAVNRASEIEHSIRKIDDEYQSWQDEMNWRRRSGHSTELW
jgi:hypothetical protein